MKYLLIILALVTGAAAGPFGTGGGGSSATAETAEVARKSLVTDSTIYRDTLVQWDSIPGANDSALVAVRDTLNQDMSDSLANYLHKTAFDDSFANHAKDSLGNWTFTGDTATVSGDTGVFNKPLRATEFHGDGSNLTGIAASGGAGPLPLYFYPGGTFYTASGFPVIDLDTNLTENYPGLKYSTTTAETSYCIKTLPDTLGDSLTIHYWTRGVTQTVDDTVVWISRFSCDGGTSFVSYIQDTVVSPCLAQGYTKHISKRIAVAALGWVKNARLYWAVIRDKDNTKDDLAASAFLHQARTDVERQ